MIAWRVVGGDLRFLAVLAGALLIFDAAGQETGPDPSAEQARADISHPLSAPAMESGEDSRQQPPMAAEGLRLAGDFKVRLPRGAVPAKSLAGIAMAGALSLSILMLCAMRGLERLVRLRVSAFGYIGFALGGLGLYALMGMRLLETPSDLATLKVTTQGDASLAETIVAFAQRRSELAGDPYDLNGVAVYDGSVNLFLADRVEFVTGQSPSLLEPSRGSLMVEVRDDAVAFYQEIEMLGMPLVVTLLVPVEGRTNALRFGKPSARIGTWPVLPGALVTALWENLWGAMTVALADVRFANAFNVERISDGFIHLALRPSGGSEAQ